jgi:hypothetical protein
MQRLINCSDRMVVVEIAAPSFVVVSKFNNSFDAFAWRKGAVAPIEFNERA